MPHGAPAKTLRRNVLERMTSRPPTCKIIGENRSRPRPDETSVREMDAYAFGKKFPCCDLEIPCSPKYFSLLICVGNRSISRCRTAISCYEIGLGSLKVAKFPVKFPDSRECARRRVRAALRRQPTSPAPGDLTLSNLRNA